MPYIIQPPNRQKLLPKYEATSSYQVYLAQIKSTVENIRFTRQGLDYIPPQFGGLFGQRRVIDQKLVLEVVDFEVKEG